MFDQMKKQLNTSRWSFKAVATFVIFGLIIAVFVLFNMQGKHTAMGVGSAARVNDALISVADLREETNRMQQMYGQMFGGQFGGEAQQQFLRSQALEGLITNELIAQQAKSQGLWVTDAEIRDFILNDMVAFQQNGKFQKDIYVRLLEMNHLTPAEFEDKVRKERKIQRSRAMFEAVSAPSTIELQKLADLHGRKQNVSFVKIDEDQLMKTLTVDDADVQKHLADPTFAKKVEADFTANKASFGTEEQVRASHILIKAKKGDSASEKAALDKIEGLKKRAETEDFGKLAAETSEDQGSKVQKGDLGFFGHGKMVPEFDKAAFAQKTGVVGEPVKTDYGYHLIKVTEHKAASEASFDAVKNQIAKKMLIQERIQSATSAIELALQKGDGAGVDQAVKFLGLSWQETGLTDLSVDTVPKLGSHVASQAMFEVSAAKPYLPRLVADGGSKFVMKFKEAKKETVAPDKKATEQITRERSYDAFTKWIENAKKMASIERNPAVLKGE